MILLWLVAYMVRFMENRFFYERIFFLLCKYMNEREDPAIYDPYIKQAIYENLLAIKRTIHVNLLTIKRTIYGNLLTIKRTIFGNLLTIKRIIYGRALSFNRILA